MLPGQITQYSQGSYQSTNTYDAFGRLQQQETGSIFDMEYGFNNPGNMSFREDNITNQREDFSYDDLNRLIGIEYSLNGNHVSVGDLTMVFDDGGNITSKSDVAGIMEYGEGNAGPHAVTSVKTLQNDYLPKDQQITYTCFNKVASIIQLDENDDEIVLDCKGFSFIKK